MKAQWRWAVLVSACVVGAAACRQSTQPQQAETAASSAMPGTAPASNAQPTAAPAGAQPGSPEVTAGAPATTAAVAAAPPEPEYREVTVPAGTALSVVLDTRVSSNGSAVEDAVRGHLASPVRLGGVNALPSGSRLLGTVVEAKASAKVKGRARVALRFDRIVVQDEGYSARTSVYAREARSTKGKDAKKIGIGAGAGAIVGGIIGGGKGAAIGAGVGGGAGTGVVLATKGEEVSIPAGAQVRVTLKEPVTVRVPVSPPR